MDPDARAELAALCSRGLEWRTHPSRVLPPSAAVRRAAVLVLFGVLDSVPARASVVPPDGASVTGGAGRAPFGPPAPGFVAPDLDVLLLRRAATLGSHPSQIAFPGGRLEPADDGPVAAAVREAVEETGVDRSGVDVLGTLPELPLAASHHLVTPVVAWWTRPSQVAAVDHDETVEVFRVPVADLVEPENRAYTLHVMGPETLRMPAFTVQGRLVWGFTALVLSRLFDELGWAEPWDHDRVVQPDS